MGPCPFHRGVGDGEAVTCLSRQEREGLSLCVPPTPQHRLPVKHGSQPLPNSSLLVTGVGCRRIQPKALPFDHPLLVQWGKGTVDTALHPGGNHWNRVRGPKGAQRGGGEMNSPSSQSGRWDGVWPSRADLALLKLHQQSPLPPMHPPEKSQFMDGCPNEAKGSPYSNKYGRCAQSSLPSTKVGSTALPAAFPFLQERMTD